MDVTFSLVSSVCVRMYASRLCVLWELAATSLLRVIVAVALWGSSCYRRAASWESVIGARVLLARVCPVCIVTRACVPVQENI